MIRNMLHVLQSIINSASETETSKLIARFLLEHLDDIEEMTIYELVDGCYTSNSTVSRFVKSLGLTSFIEMRERLSLYKDYGIELSTESLEDMQFDGKHNQVILNGYIENLCSSLKTMEDISFEELKKLNKAIFETKEVTIFGTQISGLLAKNYQLMMMSMGKVMHCCDDTVSHLDATKSIDNQHLVIILSTDGNYINGNKNVIFALKKKGAKMILITHNPTCKFISQFDQVIFMGEYTGSKSGRYKLQLCLEMLVNLYAVEYFK